MSRAWTRDAFDRLTEWQKVMSWSPLVTATQETYGYSPIGNMTSKAGVTITNGTAKSGVVKMFRFEAFTVYSPTDPGASFAYRPSSATWSFESRRLLSSSAANSASTSP